MSQLEERFSQPKYWEELISFCVGLKLRGFKRMADRSRMNREVHVRCCGGLEVKFLRSTQLGNEAFFSEVVKFDESLYIF